VVTPFNNVGAGEDGGSVAAAAGARAGPPVVDLRLQVLCCSTWLRPRTRGLARPRRKDCGAC
jgi:hypothetical protein